jgi:hypothetical protein
LPNDEENFTRTILHLCKSKGECSYLEAKEQFINGVIESADYYNTWIMVRVRDTHIKDYIERQKNAKSIPVKQRSLIVMHLRFYHQIDQKKMQLSKVYITKML